MTIEIKTTGRDGALTSYRIVGGAEHEQSMPSLGYSHSLDGADVVGRASKSGVQRLRDWVSTINTAKSTSTNESADRVIVRDGSVSIGSVINGRIVASLGRSWFCSWRNVDEHSLPPEWEGELIQYAYLEDAK